MSDLNSEINEVEVGKEAYTTKPQPHAMDATVADISGDVQGTTPEELLEQILKVDDTKLLPWEEVYLPSAGVYYNGRIPDGLVRVRPMGAQDDKILATPRLAQSGQSLDYVFKNCVELPEGFDPLDLLAGDRIFLLYVLRGITHGNMYEFAMPCAQCEASTIMTYDLNQLSETIQGPILDLGDEPFKVVLPFMTQAVGKEISVDIRLLRGRDANKFASNRRFKKRVSPGQFKRRAYNPDDSEDNIIESIIMSIVGFCGSKSNPEKMKQLVNKMHSRDLATIREFMKKCTPGIDTTINVNCPDCGAEFKTELPITEGFFRPATK